MKNLLIAIDLSTASTGWALFNFETKELLDCGNITINHKGISTLVYPKGALERMKRMSRAVADHILKHKDSLKHIAVEEINPGKNRLGQKTLDGCHFFLMEYLGSLIDIVYYKDSNGADGWRKQLGHALSDQDKALNKQIREQNKGIPKKHQKRVYTVKDVTIRWVNTKFNKKFNLDKNPQDTDVADAIALGWAVITSN